jgi:hypothetical protein
MTKDELSRIEAYLRGVFRLPDLAVKARPKKNDSAEVYIGEEFIGIIFRDDEDEEVSYNFQMAILEYDLN